MVTNVNSSNIKVRVPVGRLILELPAGMLDDDSGDFLGTAVREVFLFSLFRCVYVHLCMFISHISSFLAERNPSSESLLLFLLYAAVVRVDQ